MNRPRKAPPSCVRYMYRAIANAKFEQLTLEQLVKILKHDALLSDEAAAETVRSCINDKILIPVVSENGRGSPRLKINDAKRPLSLPKPIEIPTSKHDYYCFECHLPGNLKLCPKCPRTFHRECYRKEPEKPNYEVPSTKVQKNPLPEFSCDVEEEVDNFDFPQETKSLTPQLPVDSADTTMESPVQMEEKKGYFLPISDLNFDTKLRVDVMCMGEVRPPNRSRRFDITSSYAKNEVITTEEDEDDDALCTCCRLSKCAVMRNPPNLEPDELCHLLNFTYSRNKTWISPETITYIDSLKSTNKDIEILRKVLLQTPATLKEIGDKIANREYNYTMELLIDILDIQHNVGVLFGECIELESTKYLVRDVTHDLAEISRCPDCYRYSNQKSSLGWFCKPCVQRHELVFAKYPGFSFWPAKIIRVLPNNKYDVRFFGGSHSRALVDVKHIRSIDTDVKQLKLLKTNGLRSAMQEMRHHQLLSQYPASQFAYGADASQVEMILERVLGRTIPQRQRRSDISHAFPQFEDETGEQSMVVTQSSSRKRKRYSNSANQSKACHTRSKQDLLPTLQVQLLQKELDEALNIIDNRKKKQTELMNQVKSLKETIVKMERNIEIVKRKQWCFWCYEEAILLCCFKASYCSQQCQKAHWDDGHSKVCKNRELN